MFAPRVRGKEICAKNYDISRFQFSQQFFFQKLETTANKKKSKTLTLHNKHIDMLITQLHIFNSILGFKIEHFRQ